MSTIWDWQLLWDTKIRPAQPWLPEAVFTAGNPGICFFTGLDASGKVQFIVYTNNEPYLEQLWHEAGHAAHLVASQLRDAAEGRGTAGTDIIKEIQVIVCPNGPEWAQQPNEMVAEAFRKANTGNTNIHIYPDPAGQADPYPLDALRSYFAHWQEPRIVQPAATPAPAGLVVEDFMPIPSTNFMVGRDGSPTTLIVDHWMAGTLASADARFKTPGSQVSAHYGVSRDGRIVQWVAEADTAYHAGDWGKNVLSIGIEHEASPTMPPTDALYAASAQLHADIARRHSIRLEVGTTVLPHRAIVPTACPGTLDLVRIVNEAGGDMAFKDDPDAQAFVADVRATFEAIKVVLAAQAHHKHKASAETDEPEQ